MQCLLPWLTIVLGIMTVTKAAPEAAPHHSDPAIDPAIAFLKQLRKARKYGGGGGILGNRDESGAENSESFSQQQFSSQSQNRPTSVPILFPSGGSSASSTNDQRFPISIPANLPSFARPTSSSPQDIRRINSGVSTILNGVRDFDLGQILRGAFIFPRNDNVKNVANNVIDTIFGPLGGGGSSGGGDAPDVPNRNRGARN